MYKKIIAYTLLVCSFTMSASNQKKFTINFACQQRYLQSAISVEIKKVHESDNLSDLYKFWFIKRYQELDNDIFWGTYNKTNFYAANEEYSQIYRDVKEYKKLAYSNSNFNRKCK